MYVIPILLHQVTGEATEAQIIEALRRYATRPVYVQKSLFYLFSITQVYTEPRKDIIEVILPAMQVLSKRHHIDIMCNVNRMSF